MTPSIQTPFTLIYHAGLPGRAEFIRLYFEATGQPYHDSAKVEGQDYVWQWSKNGFEGSDNNPTPFAPPVLKHGKVVIHQTANIILYLSSLLPPIDLESGDTDGEPSAKKIKHSGDTLADVTTFHKLELLLTVLDCMVEAHDVHHPVSTSLYYEDQKPEALKAAEQYKTIRVPKFLAAFESNLEKAGSGFLLKGGVSYADLALFHLVDGLEYAFPNYAKKELLKHPLVNTLHSKIKSSPRISRYLNSDRRAPWSLHGIFRHYPELDDEE